MAWVKDTKRTLTTDTALYSVSGIPTSAYRVKIIISGGFSGTANPLIRVNHSYDSRGNRFFSAYGEAAATGVLGVLSRATDEIYSFGGNWQMTSGDEYIWDIDLFNYNYEDGAAFRYMITDASGGRLAYASGGALTGGSYSGTVRLDGNGGSWTAGTTVEVWTLEG